MALTVGLLAFGAASVLAEFATIANLGASIGELYRLQGIGAVFGAEELADRLGFVVNVIRVAALIWAFVESIRRIRSGRLAFWVPLVAGVVATFAFAAVMIALVGSDPVFHEYVRGLSSPQG